MCVRFDGEYVYKVNSIIKGRIRTKEDFTTWTSRLQADQIRSLRFDALVSLQREIDFGIGPALRHPVPYLVYHHSGIGTSGDHCPSDNVNAVHNVPVTRDNWNGNSR